MINPQSLKYQFDRIFKKSDLVITPGILLYKQLKKIKSNIIRIPHGCDDRYLKKFLKKVEVEVEN